MPLQDDNKPMFPSVSPKTSHLVPSTDAIKVEAELNEDIQMHEQDDDTERAFQSDLEREFNSIVGPNMDAQAPVDPRTPRNE